MSVPKQRQTRGRSRRRRSQHRLGKLNLNKCAHCGRPLRSHRACEFCGYYKGKQVLDIKVQSSAKTKKDKK